LLEHHALVGQSGQRVLGGEFAHVLGAAIERTQHMPGRVHGDKRAYTQDGADQCQQAPQPVHRGDKPAIAGPTKPPDDAAAGIMQGLHRAPGFADRIGVEAEIGEAAAARDLPQLHVVGRVDVAKLRVEFVKRLLQRGALLRLDVALADSRGSKAGSRAQQYRAYDDQRQKQG
jgi:hypothetical protein